MNEFNFLLIKSIVGNSHLSLSLRFPRQDDLLTTNGCNIEAGRGLVYQTYTTSLKLLTNLFIENVCY